MQTIFKGAPLTIGERIPGTALTFVRPILPRRGEFVCDCGRSKPFQLSDIENGYKSCGCGCHKNRITKIKGETV